jgi:LysM repeat protein
VLTSDPRTKETCKDLKDKKFLVLPLTPKPLVRTVKYKLLKGDTCKSVATKFNVPEKAIKKSNKIL